MPSGLATGTDRTRNDRYPQINPRARSSASGPVAAGEYTCLRTSADPDAVTSVLGKVLAIQGTQKVAETRETDDELVPKIRLEKFAGALHRFPDDGVVWMNEAFIGRYGNR